MRVLQHFLMLYDTIAAIPHLWYKTFRGKIGHLLMMRLLVDRMLVDRMLADRLLTPRLPTPQLLAAPVLLAHEPVAYEPAAHEPAAHAMFSTTLETEASTVQQVYQIRWAKQ